MNKSPETTPAYIDPVFRTMMAKLARLKRTSAKQKAEIADLLSTYYPLVHRLACGQCQDIAAAAKVTRLIMIQSLAVLDRWRMPLEAENWFLHHTILAARRAQATPPAWTTMGDVEFQAFARAFGALAYQQREAFLLTRGESLDIRRAAIAMDCSTTAAANHLAAATATLKSLAGPDFERLTERLLNAYIAPPPPEDLVIPLGSRATRKKRLAWRAAWAIIIALILAACWAIIRWRK